MRREGHHLLHHPTNNETRQRELPPEAHCNWIQKRVRKKECEQVCMQVSCKHSSHIVLLCHHHLENRDGWNLNEKVIQQYKYIGFGRGKLTIKRTHNKEKPVICYLYYFITASPIAIPHTQAEA